MILQPSFAFAFLSFHVTWKAHDRSRFYRSPLSVFAEIAMAGLSVGEHGAADF
jgi:hypothetical protein